jgi:CPA2 family monovalent cation:H+ antiporter-2
MTPGPENYKELLLFLATASVIVPLFRRLKLSSVFEFLLLLIRFVFTA